MNLKEKLGLEIVRIEPYGSIVSGFSTKSSDIDVSINTNCYINERKFLRYINEYINMYKRINNYENIEC